MKRTAFAVVAIRAITVATPGVTFADSPEPAPLDVCDGGWKTDIYAQSKKHLGKGPIYKDGPGGDHGSDTGDGEADVANKTVGFKYWETSS